MNKSRVSTCPSPRSVHEYARIAAADRQPSPPLYTPEFHFWELHVYDGMLHNTKHCDDAAAAAVADKNERCNRPRGKIQSAEVQSVEVGRRACSVALRCGGTRGFLRNVAAARAR